MTPLEKSVFLDLVYYWERLSENLDNQSKKAFTGQLVNAYVAESQVYSICADMLKEKLKGLEKE